MKKQIFNNKKKKDNKTTEIVFILDASGSMLPYVNDTIGSFNSILEKQKRLNADDTLLITTALFNTQITILHDRKNIKKVSNITQREYMACGGTALYDAVGETIKYIDAIQKHVKKCDAPQKTMFIINTGGYENSSRKYSQIEVKNLIEEMRQQGWEFIFLGANIDVVNVADDIGIRENRCAEYVQNKTGIFAQEECLNSIIREYRVCECDCLREDRPLKPLEELKKKTDELKK